MRNKSEFERYRAHHIEKKIPTLLKPKIGEVYLFPYDGKLAEFHLFTEKNWEHISIVVHDNPVLPANRLPTYEEMVTFKNVIWDNYEVCIQVHPKKSQYVNINPFCLHIWKKAGESYKESEMIKSLIKAFPSNASTSIHVDHLQIDGKTYVVVAGPNRWPTWDEMCKIKTQYFDPEEPAVQYHLSKAFDLNQKYIMVLASAPQELPTLDLL